MPASATGSGSRARERIRRLYPSAHDELLGRIGEADAFFLESAIDVCRLSPECAKNASCYSSRMLADRTRGHRYVLSR